MAVNRDFPVHPHDFIHDRWSIRRYKLTITFLEKYIPEDSNILDLGTENGLGNYMKAKGYKVENTNGEDFDVDYRLIDRYYLTTMIDVVTAFEIFEHLMNPLAVAIKIPSNKLMASIPLRLWFAKSFKNKTNPAGWHFHEFERWQFDWMLEKAGWKIIARETHTSPTFRLGFRSILRWITPRIYLVYAERI
jgi:hypothetical protein